jgi:hypothetical protein
MLDFPMLLIIILFGMSVFMMGYGWSVEDRGNFFMGLIMLLATVGLALMVMSGTKTIFIPYFSDMLGSA